VWREGDEVIARLSVLAEPARRAAYRALRNADRPLTRAEVAGEVGISVRLATFHLERLVADGLVEATYAREDGASPVGHPAKRYRPTSLEVDVSIPPRRYDLAAKIFAAALARAAESSDTERLATVAAEYGRHVGAEPAAHNGDSQLVTALRRAGYEPAKSGDHIVLRNCPFKEVATALPDVVCAMNLAFVEGVLAGAQVTSLSAELSPSAERCCVVVAAA
jgi:predicted ArsR family transcriptional regulator